MTASNWKFLRTKTKPTSLINMHLLIDSDSLCYRAGFSANLEGQEKLACWQLRKLVDTILADVQPQSYKLFLSGSGNFRYKYYDKYKATRSKTKRPIHLQVLREHLCETYVTTITDGIEADDAVSIEQWAGHIDVDAVQTCIAGIDKDLLCIPGQHYNFDKKTWRFQTELDSMRWFFYQCIMGDRADNIPGFDGIMRLKVPQKLEWAVNYLKETESIDDMLRHVYDMYGSWEALDLSASCLWLLRKDGDVWTNWQNQETIDELRSTEASGLLDASTPSSPLSSEPEVESGHPNTSV